MEGLSTCLVPDEPVPIHETWRNATPFCPCFSLTHDSHLSLTGLLPVAVSHLLQYQGRCQRNLRDLGLRPQRVG